MNGEAGKRGGADAFERFIGDAVLGDFFDFEQEFVAGEIDLVG